MTEDSTTPTEALLDRLLDVTLTGFGPSTGSADLVSVYVGANVCGNAPAHSLIVAFFAHEYRSSSTRLVGSGPSSWTGCST